VECDLIYDVGIHDGNDTAYYLAEGYRVLAIDANPAHIERATKRFEHELNDERLRRARPPSGSVTQSASGARWTNR
jgi:hypothetical protein